MPLSGSVQCHPLTTVHIKLQAKHIFTQCQPLEYNARTQCHSFFYFSKFDGKFLLQKQQSDNRYHAN